MTDHDDLLTILQSAQTTATDDGYLTARELRARMPGMSEQRLRARLRELDAAGRLDVQYVMRPNLAHRTQAVPAYRLRA